MAAAAARLLGPQLRAGLAIVPDAGPHPLSESFSVIAGSHPMPTPASEDAGRRALALAQSTRGDERLLVLLSGGASSLMAAPADGIALADKARATEMLLKGGADIQSLNTVRKHLSAVKGGRLAAASAAPTIAFAISDVVGDDLSVIGSGPTVPDPTTFGEALAVLRTHGGVEAYPAAVVAHLSRGGRGEIDETPKPGDPRLAGGAAYVIGGRRDAMRGAAGEAARRGYVVQVIDEPVVGEARDAARARIAAAAGVAHDAPVCLISSGETIVHVTGTGRGGRNQEFALAAAGPLASWSVPVALASVGTDGVDGPTSAAGALADPTTVARAARAGLSSVAALENNDAFPFFDAIGDLIHTGPTGTNVGDLQIILLA
jgi:hydroxypyruvate reductase